ncbi:G patch domain-containing protein 1 homolog [Malaya genurostris]|uniref:G patch domain-containing protein 1 homolog n=1 Tax=Malaya genurostris TaxID=325434 RepID=UPI0026F3D441|nr:G patch domain-containing protein 1 homolog [Malaya genurostris]
MSEDEETLCRYGNPLPAYEEDEIPAKKPVSVEDQIVLDVNGKRRFHGAFTGGFSAGYWNTVGSEEGWKPTEFKSSRKEKSSFKPLNPMDFMDEEDLGEFGIAPQRVHTKEDFAQSSKSSKRRITTANWSSPIPGQPVLKALLEPAKEKTALLILKNMGWREGQGIGDRQSKVEKKKANARNRKEEYVMKMYGCELPTEKAASDSSGSESDISDYEITFAPDDFDPLVAAIKNNTFGLGYSGLERQSGSYVNIPNTLEVVDRNNKKLSIRGQAFGVGALEDDDEDIYARDDMSRYDYSLDDKPKKPVTIKSVNKSACLEGFCLSKKIGKQNKKVFQVDLPDNYSPRHLGQRISRFEPLEKTRAQCLLTESHYKIQGLGRHDLDPKKRGQILDESSNSLSHSSTSSITDMINHRSKSFVKEEIINKTHIDEPGTSKTNTLKFETNAELTGLGSTKEGFKPFIIDVDKQERYDKFLCYKPSDRFPTKESFLSSLQPLEMSSWDRERELKEFNQAQRMYRPMDGLMFDRFVTESSLIMEKSNKEQSEVTDVVMKRSTVMWKPHKELCKRFNVPEPFSSSMGEIAVKVTTKMSVFDYIETPVNSKSNFVTPVIIPKSIPKLNDKSKESLPIRESVKKVAVEKEKPSTSYETNPVQQPSIIQKSVKRTELEQKVLESINKKPEDKKDLFKSIFCSSDEEEEDAETGINGITTVSISKNDKLKLVESFIAIKPASQMNVLRNDSPPRGIFKSILDIKTPNQPNETLSRHDHSANSSFSSDDEMYGPKLPCQMPVIMTPDNAAKVIETSPYLKNKEIDSKEIIEEWVEKRNSSSKSKKKKHKEHKKSKKQKKEKKKSKHKN